MGALIG